MTGKKLVSKHNKLISASYSLGVPEQRVIFLAIVAAREQKKLIDARGVLQIYASSYQEQFKVEKHSAYKALKSATKGLFDAYFEYDDIHEKTGKPVHYLVNWVQKIAYIDTAGMIEIQFTDDVIPLITRLSEQYTEYDLKQVSELQSEYAIRLYELMMQWKSVGKTKEIAIDDLRKKLGVKPEQYKAMSDFKKRVLDHGIKQINEHTDITVKYEQHKTGKTIAAVSFAFKKKKILEHIDPAKNKNRDTTTPDLFHNMTDSQISTFSAKLAALPELGSNAPIGKSTAEFAAIIASDLADEDKQLRYMPYLAKLGYQPAKRK
ncbi:replication initiation protein [Psychrobacter sp. ANT_H56B]|uniref:replication initiation protein RepM n=1 Tax=unclassified Psychrobacter TaxID=196806 RepID=UPI0011F13869|nr:MULTISPECIES: replication initiation protein RepM [unclassified Psychrobacter]KAA0921783.1 replication initiation protein [Psychrobacter sp. ANT_H56B]QJS05916.1 replication protein, RepB, Rep3 superfamily [Psychrobacter sp.]